VIGEVYPTPALPGVPQFTWTGETWKSGSIDTANYLLKSGGTMTGPLALAADPAADMQAATRRYVDTVNASGNLLINGFHDVSQETAFGTSLLLTSASQYPSDQWLAAGAPGFTVSNGTVTAFGIDRNIGIVAPAGYAANSAHAAYFVQPIEGNRWSKMMWGTATAGIPVSIGFWVYSNVAGVMSVSIRNSASNRAYCSPVSVPALVWVYRTVTIPPCMDGAWPIDTGAAAHLFLSFMRTTSLLASADNVWQSGANVIVAPSATNMFTGAGHGCYIAGVTMVMGNAAVPQERCPYMRRPLQDELQDCYRYWQWNAYSESGFAQGTGTACIWHQPRVVYRVTPALALATTSFYMEGPPWATAVSVTNGAINGTHAAYPTRIDYQITGTFSVSPAAYTPMALMAPNVVKFNARM
jgi:hypothetical protein